MSSEDVGSGVQHCGRTTSSPVFITARNVTHSAAPRRAAQRSARRAEVETSTPLQVIYTTWFAPWPPRDATVRPSATPARN